MSPRTGKQGRNRNRWLASALALALVAAPAIGGTVWTVDWWTVDGGGEVFTTGDRWQLSGSFGQWDATPHNRSKGGAWALTGGFWSIAATESDHLFSDGYE